MTIMWWTYMLLIGFWNLNLTSQNEEDTTYPMYYTDSCDEAGGKAITCDEGHVIKIYDVRCMPYNHTCSEREKISRLCDGLRSCSNIDLRRQLNYYCKDYPSKKVFTSFKCIPDVVKPFCRTNLCSDESSDVRCRRGKVFHMLDAKCYHGKRDCPTDVYLAIYKVCEGQRACTILDLRASLPRGICDISFVQQENVFVDYICLDSTVVTDKCTGTFIPQTPRYGILQNPGYPGNPDGSQSGCYWAIYPSTGQEINVIVHLAYSKEGREDCNSRFLQVQYTVCETSHMQFDRFCDEGRINVKIRSCGTVYVVHYPYLAGKDRGNRFLISYAVKSPSTRIKAYEPYSYQCEKTNPSNAKYTITYEKPYTTAEEATVTTERSILPEDQPINDSSVGDPEVESIEEEKNNATIPHSDPWRLVTLLRVVVVNIFLGLLIVALIMALAFICYRYKTYGRENNKRSASKSNTATTLDEKNSTELQLLPGDDDKNSATNKVQVSSVKREPEPTQDVTSFSISSPYETTIFHFNRPDSANDDETLFYDTGTGVSSFLPHPPLRRGNNKLQNTESAYCSLENCENRDQNVEYSEINDFKTDSSSASPGHKPSQVHPTRQNLNDSSQNIRDSLQHYKINGDEYAVISKSPEHRISPQCRRTGDQSAGNMGDHAKETNRMYSSPTCDGSKNYSKKPIAHIHPVPEDCHHDDNASPTTMHVIPQHDCLLHKIPPPPPPAKMPQGHVIQEHWGMPARHYHNSDGQWTSTHYHI